MDESNENLLSFSPDLTEDELEDFVSDNVEALPPISDLKLMLRTAYTNTCGDAGFETFNATVMDRLEVLYGQDPKKFAFKGVNIIRDSGSQPESQIDKFLQSVISESDLSIVQERPHIIEQLVQSALNEMENGVNMRSVPFRENIAAVIIYGSYAYNSFDRESDLDVLYVTRDGTPRLTADFSRRLQEFIPFRPIIENADNPISLDQIEEELSVIPSKRLVITPFDDIKEIFNRHNNTV